MGTSGIYAIVNLITGKMYIGSAVNFEKRWKNHRIELRLNRHINIYLQASWNKHGEDAFQFIIFEYCNKEVLLEREQLYLDFYKPYDRTIGYNIQPTAGSNLGYKPTAETLNKLSAIRKGKKRSEEAKAAIKAGWEKRRAKGPVSAETRAKQSAAQTGKKKSEETRKKMSEKKKGNDYNLGRKQDEAHIEKRRLANTGQKRSDETRERISQSLIGHEVSEETRLKQSEAAKRRHSKNNLH